MPFSLCLLSTVDQLSHEELHLVDQRVQSLQPPSSPLQRKEILKRISSPSPSASIQAAKKHSNPGCIFLRHSWNYQTQLFPRSKQPMGKPRFGKPVTRIILVFLGTVAFSCSLAAEFKKVKAKDMKLDGSLCSLPRSSAFGLGITAAVCLSIAQIVGTSQVGTRLCSGEKKIRTSRIVSITLLVSSWMSFGIGMVLLGTGSSMNGGQPYGKGWMDGKCYIVRNGVFIAAAILAVTTVVLILGFTFTAGETTHQRTGADDVEGRDDRQHK